MNSWFKEIDRIFRSVVQTKPAAAAAANSASASASSTTATNNTVNATTIPQEDVVGLAASPPPLSTVTVGAAASFSLAAAPMFTNTTTSDITAHSTDSFSLFHRLISAFVGATITSLTVTPLDVVKIRMQTQTKVDPKTGLVCCQNLLYCEGMVDQICPIPQNGKPLRYHINGVLDGVTKIVRYEGVPALWSGLSPTLVMAIPSTVIYFLAYETLREYLDLRTRSSVAREYIPLLAGGLSRTGAVTVVAPLELMRTKLQHQKGQNRFHHVVESLRDAIRVNGIRTLWKGLSPTIWRDVPFSSMYWFGFENIKRYLNSKKPPNHKQSFFERFSVAFTSGAISGMVAAGVTTPFDVAKTRRQVDATFHGNVSTAKLLKGIVQHEGVKGLFHGILPRVMRTAPACAIMISTYELFKMYFNVIDH